MQRRTLLAILLAAAATAGGWAAWRLLRTPPTDEERIQALLAGAARAAEERRVGDAVAAVSERFSGHGLDRQGVKQLVTYQVLRGEWVAVSVAGSRVEVSGDAARAAVDVVLARSGSGRTLADLLPASGSVQRLLLALEREDGEWKVVRARWRAVPVQEALDGPVLPAEGP
ncbi:MAG: hypothetical protein HZB56_05620 [Deltaproteobacteria bacterium]|nr:hypothetical protein [Deltaproteobacteria bacterium]